MDPKYSSNARTADHKNKPGGERTRQKVERKKKSSFTYVPVRAHGTVGAPVSLYAVASVLILKAGGGGGDIGGGVGIGGRDCCGENRFPGRGKGRRGRRGGGSDDARAAGAGARVPALADVGLGDVTPPVAWLLETQRDMRAAGEFEAWVGVEKVEAKRRRGAATCGLGGLELPNGCIRRCFEFC